MKKTITIQELKKVLEKNNNNSIVIDVRSKKEYDAVNINESINIPLDQIEKHKKELEKYDTVYIHCQSGNRSQKACQYLSDLKNTNVVNILGGIQEWQSKGLPVVKSKNIHFSIIQQVHIIAGSLILLGVILSKFLNPNLIYLSGVIGAGLLFAGLTGWCGMAKILSKMPWNK